MTVGEKIKARRKELGWLQEDLAVKAGLGTGTISRLEGHGLLPRADRLAAIAAALDLSLDELMAAS